MNLYRKLVLTLFSVVMITASTELQAQDIHWSQFYNSPLLQNPALTGHFDGHYRLIGNYRNQWSVIPPKTPFATIAVGYDMKVPEELQLVKEGSLAWGIQAFNDQSGLGHLTTTSFLASASYNYELNDQHSISAGLQLGFFQKAIDYSRLTWGNQLSENGDGPFFDQSLAHGENTVDNLSGMVLNAGGMWVGKINDDLGINAGIGLFNLNRPKESFLGDAENRLDRRIAIHGGARYKLNETAAILPNLLIMMQGKAQEIVMGASYAKVLTEGKLEASTVYAGLHFRSSLGNFNSDALIPSIGLKYKKVKVELSYDGNYSTLRKATNLRGGPEISVIYIGEILSTLPVKPIMPCIRY